MKPKILLIYTGGTIGMIKDPATKALKAFNFKELLLHIPELRQLECEITTLSYDHPIDSSNMNLSHWQEMGATINTHYDDFDGFVILHGSDTMAYTGSALSFMFEHLTKPIILTGSQLPIGDLRTDAKENLITTIELASQWEQGRPIIQEVCIYFEYQLYRANRTVKVSADRFEAFASPNYPPLAVSGVHLKVDRGLLWQQGYDEFAFAKAKTSKTSITQQRMNYRPDFVKDVVVLKIFPAITQSVVEAICNIPGLRGIVLETYGSGNAPSEPWFVALMKKALDQGIYIVNVTQCRGGAVDMGKYETSIQLKEIGMVSGKDITTESALAKMMYLLNYTSTLEDFKHYFEKSLRGELTV
ncbi:1-alkyl-2-acetylglycerophosphocholine esterase [Nonlabens sp. YIK11]|uniref:asparaginase n=1 Tax=Nonlabens sp. YIK11 TaxID=1453349 RepID=UPI0006DC2020|nr:asparaginase [Nonlabens sp. YIK11]KQC32091.1 1-alkyl-2-acetylglycerophosphocholine esterase [Nonlabens sp. YIK11]